MEIPKEYLPIMPYLILDDAKGFLDFAKTVFGATEQMIVPGELENEIRHGEIRIGDAVVMFANATSEWGQKSAGMFIYVESVDKVYDLALRQKSKSLQIPNRAEYGYTAGFEDLFGNQWWITEPTTT